MSARRENEHKRFVEVRAEHALDGSIKPLLFREEDDLFCRIDDVMDVREAPALKAGGQGTRYTCRVQDHVLYLFHDDAYWFIEETDESACAGKVEKEGIAMCGRYFIGGDADEAEMRQIIEQLNHRYEGKPELAQMQQGEIFPTAIVPVISNSKALKPTPFLMKWGYSHYQGNGVIINARAETALEKPMLKKSMLERRCLIPASNYFEWECVGKTKRKYAIQQKDAGLTYMAGIYRLEEAMQTPTFVILTCDAAADIAFIHPRMPLLLPLEEREAWLSPSANITDVMDRAQRSAQCLAVPV
ncbi:MAG: SOS response-associated peptidase [Clostridia bacterium]